MPRKGKKFEIAYKWLYDLDKDKYKVTSPAYLYDSFSERKREVDVLIEFYDNNNINRKLAIECRDRKNVQDVMWIEQLQQKKEDLSLDYILATTTSDFTQSAIKKAKKHGIIIEKAESFNINSIKEVTTNEFFYDAFFFKFTFEELKFLVRDKGYIPLRDFIKQSNFAEQMELLRDLNKTYYLSIEPNNFLKESKIKEEIFFQNNKDNSILLNDTETIENNKYPLLFRMGVILFDSKIKITPFRLSLPLNKSLSVFEVEKKKNKKYYAFFGNDEEYVEVGYIGKNNYSNIKLLKRKYLRFAGANMYINTIFPKIKNDFKMNLNEVVNNLLGEFDFSKIL